MQQHKKMKYDKHPTRKEDHIIQNLIYCKTKLRKIIQFVPLE
jgi:hypothetical protein